MATSTIDGGNDGVQVQNEANLPNFVSKPSFESNILQLLRNVNSAEDELKLCIAGCKEFKKQLRGSFGGELLYVYVNLSPKFTELLDAWNRRKGKAGVSNILSLISLILSHVDGKYDKGNRDSGRASICRVLDEFSKFIIEEKMGDLCLEISCKEGQRQKAALKLLACVARRGSLLANDVAKKFDFKMPVVGNLAEYRRNMVKKRKHSTRGAFVEFAMSFLEVGKPGLVKWILQQREVFSGILQGLGNDDDETVVYILSTLRDRVLNNESEVPPPLRSVLFGSVTLEQLVEISSRGEDVLAAKISYEVLYMVCIDPSNGLMPDPKRKPNPLKGNHKRLVDLMKKLKATDVEYHRRLLLAIVNGRPALASSYLDQFPYNLEDHTSLTWLSAVTLAAKVVSSVTDGIEWDFLAQQDDSLLTFDDPNVRNVYKCVCFRPFSRLVVNKGLLHSDSLIKHGTLRLVLEVMKLFNSFVDAISLHGLSSLKQKLKDEVRILLPDSQVLFTLISSVGTIYQNSRSSRKRTHSENICEIIDTGKKRRKANTDNEDVDILVGGLHSANDTILFDDSEKIEEEVTLVPSGSEIDDGVLEIWDSDESFLTLDVVNKEDVFFHCKVLEALKIYHRTLIDVLEVSYDVLKILPSNPLELPTILLQSLLSMLIEHFGCSTESDPSRTMLPPIYKHLQSLLVLFLQAPNKDIRHQAYILAKAAMMSSGAFDQNSWEVGSWFLFLPGNIGPDDCCRYTESKLHQPLSTPVVSFLCDAVSTVGNNLVKYWDILKCRHSSVEISKEKNVSFSPLIICILEKCLRLLGAGAGTFTLPEKTLISLYVCNTLKYLLQTQVEAGSLAAVIHQLLSEKVENQNSDVADAESYFCEWRPLISLTMFSQSIKCQETCNSFFSNRVPRDGNQSFADKLAEANSLLNTVSTEGFEMFKAAYFTIICSNPDDLLQHLPSVMALSGKIPGFHHYVMNYFGLAHSVLEHISKLWPNMFRSGLEMSLEATIEVSENNRKQTSIEHGSYVFGSFLKEAPFFVLFPALIFCGQESCSKIEELLLAKASNLSAENFISSLQLVLFWFYQIQLSYRKRPSEQHEWLSQVCYNLVERILGLTSSLKLDNLSISGQEVAKTVFVHPALTSALSCPFKSNYELTEEIIKGCSEGHLCHSAEKICKLELLSIKMLTTTCECLLALCVKENLSSLNIDCKENITKSFKNLVQWLFLIFKDRVDLWFKSQSMTLLPILYAVVALIRFISPIDLLELADWILTRAKLSDSMLSQASNLSPVCLAFAMASAAFDKLSQFVKSLDMKVTGSHVFWANRMKGFDASLFQSIYLEAFHVATVSEIDLADICLVKALSVAHSMVNKQEFLPFRMEITRVITSTPANLVSHCIYGINVTKAKLLSLLVELSPLHFSIFGCLVSEILRKGYDRNVSSDQEMHLLLLPAAILHINSSRSKVKEQSPRDTETIPAFYTRLLIDGLIHWKDFVSKPVFMVDYGKFSVRSVEDLFDLFPNSLLGKAVNVLWSFFASIEDNIGKRLEMFSSIFPCSGALESFLDFDVGTIYSAGELLNLTNGTVAKIYVCLKLLFPEDYDKCPSTEIHVGKGESFVESSNQNSLRVKFLDMLVCAWQQMVKKHPSACHNQDEKTHMLRSLEVFIFRSICTLTLKMQSVLIQMHPVPYVLEIVKAALLHRFGDPITLENLRRILLSLSDGDLPVALILQLLLAHSQLPSAIANVGGSSDFAVSGIAVKPVSSFLKPCTIPSEKDPIEPERYRSQLEVIKLLRLLFHLRARQDGSLLEDDLGVNLRELVFLLLSSYGATVGEIDIEIHGVLSEIEPAKGTGPQRIAELDYMWGSSLSLRKENQVGSTFLSNDMGDVELELKRSQFRDYLPINPKILAETIVHFPYNGSGYEKTPFFDNSQHDHVKYGVEGNMNLARFKIYDPVFVLSLSIHSLSMTYLDPVEFAGLGLLAVAVLSVASVEERIRKLGYEVLGIFNDALKSSKKRREVKRLKLLMTYLQNGVEEPWQRFPTISAVFVAEASVVLLDSSHEHFLAISKFLSQTSRIDVKKIPFFRDVFGTGSEKYRPDRLWMLRLLYAGINYEDDALIFIRNSVPEILLSDYTSSTSDIESKELILQVVNKCVKEQTMAHYLIEKCCLISWLSSVLALSLDVTSDDDLFVSKKFTVVLEVVQEIVSSGNTMELLQKHTLDQLSDLSYHLLNLLVTRSNLVRKAVPSAIVILKIIVSTLEISQKQDVCLPRLNLSMRSLYQLYEAVDKENFGQYAELGLKGLEELSKFLVWGVSTALFLDSQQAKRQKNFQCHTMCLEKLELEDSLTSKLLRWFVASVVLQRVSCNLGDLCPSYNPIGGKGETLLSLLEYVKRGDGASNLNLSYREVLAAHIFHLVQHLGMKCRVLPSAVAALSILLSDRFDLSVGELDNPSNIKSLMSKISYPREANPAWKWSWADQTERGADFVGMDELYACQNLLVKILETMENKSLDYSLLLPFNLESRVLECD